MSIEFTTENNIIKIENIELKKLVYINVDNFYIILINDDKYEVYNIKNINQIQKIQDNIIKYSHVLFISNQSKNIVILQYLEKIFNFKYLKYYALDFKWYSLIHIKTDENELLEENIFYELDDKIELDLNLNLKKSITNNEILDLENQLNIFQSKYDDLNTNIKEKSLESIITLKKDVEDKFKNTNKLLKDIDDKYDIIMNNINLKTNEFKSEIYNDELNSSNVKKILLTNDRHNDLKLKRKNKNILRLHKIEKDLKIKHNINISYYDNIKKDINYHHTFLQSLKNDITKLYAFKNKLIQENNKLSESYQSTLKENELEKNNHNDTKILDDYKRVIELKEKKIDMDVELNETILPNTAIFFHIYNIELYDEFIEYIKNLKKSQITFDLYINIALNKKEDKKKPEYKNLLQKINKFKLSNQKIITFSDNRGMDIGGFITSYIKMLELKKSYSDIIKIHTKTNINWRFAMLYSLLGNKDIINNNIDLLNNPIVGCIGNQLVSLNNVVNVHCLNDIKIYLERFNLNLKKHYNFIPGTMFWIKGKILEKYFTIDILKKCYNEFDYYYCGSIENKLIEGKPHAFERLFGIILGNHNLRCVTFDVDKNSL